MKQAQEIALFNAYRARASAVMEMVTQHAANIQG